MIRMHLLAASALSAAIAPPSVAAPVTGNDPARFERVLKAAGYELTTAKDSEGVTLLKVKTAKTNFSVYFYNCTNDRDCMSYQLSAGYDLTNPTSAQKMNAWNVEKRFARAYIDDEGDPFLTADISINAPGGTSDALIVDNVKWFLAMAASFETYTGFRK